MKRGICALLIVVVCLVSSVCFISCDPKTNYDEVYTTDGNLVNSAVYYDSSNSVQKKFKIASEYPSYSTIDLGVTTKFNTVTLKENGENILTFSIYASNDKDHGYTLLFEGDTIEDFRLCYVGDQSYRYIRVCVSTYLKKYEVTEVGVYYKKSSKASELDVVSYLIADRINEDTDCSSFDAITKIILFGCLKVDSEGKLVCVDGNGNLTDKQYVLDKISLLKEKIGSRDIQIIVDLLPYNTGEDSFSKIMENHMDEILASSHLAVTEYGFDGFDIDYEFPYSSKNWKIYSEYLVKLRGLIGDDVYLSCALGPWGVKLSKEAIACLDAVQVMTYDWFDSHGYQAAFNYSAVYGMDYMVSLGFAKEQLNFGLPFYSRPIDKGQFWGDYSAVADELGYSGNVLLVNSYDHEGNPMSKELYYNSAQMIKDKVAYTIDMGYNGVMIWHFSCDVNYDSDLSLFKAIKTAMNEKQA